MPPAITVRDLGKLYRIGAREAGYRTFRDAVLDAMSAPLRRAAGLFRAAWAGGAPPSNNTIWALKGVSFEVQPGEVVGIIGRNGSGKSTLLKVLSRITEPTEGRAEIRGRIASLLEVGTGFHPELTGRENTFLNAAILGMARAEVRRKFDEIVAFAEVEKFIDTPVKHYSSGMYVRLAFAVAAHLEPDILLVDEVLAVGDAAFQKKCLGKMSDVAGQGRTVLFVSHNMAAVSRLCRTSLCLNAGRVVWAGPSADVIAKYQSQYLKVSAEWKRDRQPEDTQDFAFLCIQVKNEQGQTTGQFRGDEAVCVEMDYVVRQPLSACQVALRLYAADGSVILTTTDADAAGVSALPKEPGRYAARVTIPANLLSPGTYSILVGGNVPQRDVYDVVEQAAVFEVTPSGSLTALDGRFGVVSPVLVWDSARNASA